MAHINDYEGGVDPTVTAYIVRTDFEEPKVLLHWHKKHDKWLQFGGHIDPGETPYEALAREIREESGYALSQLDILQPAVRLKKLSDAILHPQPVVVNTHHTSDTHRHTDQAFAFTTSVGPQESPQEDESDLMQLFSLDELNSIEVGQIPENVRETAKFILSEVVGSYEPVNAQDFDYSSGK